jgi:hypothetical protein
MRLALFLILAVLLFHCEDDSDAAGNACAAEDPMSVEWLLELKSSIKLNCGSETSIIRGKYLNETVFFVTITDARANYVFAPTLYDCSGTIVRKFSMNGKDQDDVAK